MDNGIINRGRGPEIAGTRITVYNIMDYVREGWHHTTIAATLRLSSEQVLAAIRYIQEHQEEVTAAYERILERAANRRDSPEIEALRAQSRVKLQAELERIRQRKALEAGHARTDGGQ